jgi:hypothetical protein
MRTALGILESLKMLKDMVKVLGKGKIMKSILEIG